MAKSFLREKTEPTIFGIWPVGYSDMNPRGLDHLEFKELCLINYLTSRPVYCYFEKRITLNLEKKADCLKIFIRTNYVLAIRVG